ncbi:PAS domain-containing protein [Rhizobium sp. SL86]|uniref:PAS domain-containing protein n=1 Tax=Rhizobium sp. SL86 TaxID=2995148 RepID=UPI002272627F|nr:PAS domain-containing protein [Rhizobium sp. SL86]MCY1667839.1 PAS domain-containing protein [Rhizobium sp. SL86]
MEEKEWTGFWTLDFVTNQLTLSVGLDRLLGIETEPPSSWDDLIRMVHVDDRGAIQGVDAILRSGHAIDGELRITRPDNTLRWLQYKAEVIIGAGGQPRRAVGLMTDITVQHAARKAVQEGWARYEALVTAFGLIEFTASAEGDIAFAIGWQDLTGQTMKEAANGGWLNALHPDDREAASSNWSHSIVSLSAYAVDFRVRSAKGPYLMLMARATPLFNHDGSIRQWLGALVAALPEKSGTHDSRDTNVFTMKPAHVKAARALLGWSIDVLAHHAGVSISSVRRLEGEDEGSVGTQVRERVRAAFDAQGISFSAGVDGMITLSFAKPS